MRCAVHVTTDRPAVMAGMVWLAVACLVAAAPLAAAGDTATALYTAALTRERGLRAPGTQPSLAELRHAVADYETIVQRFPGSRLADHALWHAADLSTTAYEQYRHDTDRQTGLRLLGRLETAYPDSPFASRVPDRRLYLDRLTAVARLADLRRDTDGQAVTVTAVLDREVRFDVHETTDPPLVYLDVYATDPAPELRDSIQSFQDDPVMPFIRTGRYPGHITRIVLDITPDAGCHTASEIAPFRIVVECRLAAGRAGSPKAHPGVARDTTPPLVAANGADAVDPPVRVEPIAARDADVMTPETAHASFARQLGLGVSRIVIDPGHGGHDPGARAGGLTESTLVLDIARRVEQRLQRLDPPVEVVLTRRDDRYVPLETRTALANRVGADLFLSIHANASPNPASRGVETYVLNLATSPRTEAIAARENVTGRATMQQLETLLDAIATDSKLLESRTLAEIVQSALVGSLRAADPELRDLGVKHAPFVVLIGARMPSILVEVSFLTNDQDAALLRTDAYRDRIAEALSDAVQRYRRSLGVGAAAPLAAADDF